MKNDNKIKYTGSGKDDREPDWLSRLVGMVLLGCLVVIAVAGTAALCKWMLGL